RPSATTSRCCTTRACSAASSEGAGPTTASTRTRSKACGAPLPRAADHRAGPSYGRALELRLWVGSRVEQYGRGGVAEVLDPDLRQAGSVEGHPERGRQRAPDLWFAVAFHEHQPSLDRASLLSQRPAGQLGGARRNLILPLRSTYGR